ncbi:hypothetical protein [Paenibacillus lemnae]|nr:hypothetical protein [Paenibacillus lemnae]
MAGSLLVGVAAGTGIMMNDQAYVSMKQVVSGSGTNNSVGQIGLNMVDLSSMDIESALMAVQQERSNLLDQQLQNQIEQMQQVNQSLAELNDIIGQFKGLTSGITEGGSITISADLAARVESNGLGNKDKLDYSFQEANILITEAKSLSDAKSNSQQMDMLRLQSLSNKRNEAFETMSSFIKKMQDSRSSIIGNMR